jgi:hypothetical protein
MSNRDRGLLSLVLSILFPIIAMAETSPSANTGIEGVIFVSPSHGGPIRLGVPNTAPVANVAFVVQKGDQTVTSFTTDGEGRFQVCLPPGHYTVSRSNSSGRIGRWRFEADVVAGQVAKVQWTADSGMR